jgi:hypothetical protein
MESVVCVAYVHLPVNLRIGAKVASTFLVLVYTVRTLFPYVYGFVFL